MTGVCTRAEVGSASNPYAHAGGRTYHGMHDGRLRRLRPTVLDADPTTARVHDAFRSMVLAETYTCVAARSAFRRGDYRFGHYPAFGTAEAALPLAHDLWEFVREFPIQDDRFATFVATFEAGSADTASDSDSDSDSDSGEPLTETQFEDRLWTQLQHLHDLDRRHSQWDTAVSADPTERGFSFSFAARAFFIVGMHSGASRFARCTPRPTLVFNAHAQFDLLRDAGRMPRMQQVNRVRDARWQGFYNPTLDRFERESETIMYSGRQVETDWVCPLRIDSDPTTASLEEASR